MKNIPIGYWIAFAIVLIVAGVSYNNYRNTVNRTRNGTARNFIGTNGPVTMAQLIDNGARN